MRLFWIAILTSILLLLSGCTNMNFIARDEMINGYQVYEYDEKFNEKLCDVVVPYGLFVREGEKDYVGPLFTECEHSLFVKDGATYLNMTQAVEEGLFTVDDILEVDWSFVLFETHSLFDYTEVDHFVFRNTEKEVVVDDGVEVTRILTNSDSFYQLFLIDYNIGDLEVLGYIDAVSGDTTYTLTVYDCGIYDEHMQSFQYEETSEIHAVFMALIK